MSYYLRILCQSDSIPSASDIQEFVKEGAYFETNPEFNCLSSRSKESNWQRLTITYHPSKRPVVLFKTEKGELLSQELEEIREVVNSARNHVDQILGHIAGTRRVIAIEIDREGLSEDCWEMVDSLQAFIASQSTGMIFAPNDGFFDAKLERIASI